jgi:hypothetical protein
MKGSGFPKGETLVSPFGGASFGTFLSLEKEKYNKSKHTDKPQFTDFFKFNRSGTRCAETKFNRSKSSERFGMPIQHGVC